ncbi:MAG TPA: MFS transporter [Candidatus Limnocylindrales bacterium]|nr:MFS transporter [Candidatus Limnocylindrales bacterium]
MATTTFRLSDITSAQKKTLIAAALGWSLDAFDVMLYSLVIAHVMADFGISKPVAGWLSTFTLLASGIGGVLFGFVADRIGRTKALMLSILTYSVCSLGSGLSPSVPVLAFFRFVLGLGMGGEWNTGATLVAETWPTHLRAKAIAIVQSSWAWGYAAAALVAGVVLSATRNWRMVFFVGILPALVTLWIRKSVPESEMWKQQKRLEEKPRARFSEMFSPGLRKNTVFLFLLNFFGLFAWWGLFTWIPPYLGLPVEKGGRGFGLMQTTTLLIVLNLVGMFPGYISFGWVAERFGRKRSFIAYLFCAAVLVPIYAAARSQWAIMILGALVAFFGTGFFSGSGLIGSELFPTRIRASALGFTYNGARTLSSLAPYTIGKLAQARDLSWAFSFCALAFLMAMLMATQLPETKGRPLD